MPLYYDLVSKFYILPGLLIVCSDPPHLVAVILVKSRVSNYGNNLTYPNHFQRCCLIIYTNKSL